MTDYKELIECLREEAEAVKAVEWDIPICTSNHIAEAADAIEQLVGERDEWKTLGSLANKRAEDYREMRRQRDKAIKERDAVIAELRGMVDNCYFCLHYNAAECLCNSKKPCCVDGNPDRWVWRGVREEKGMRDILFRGKAVKSGEWHYGMFCAEGFDADFPCIIPSDSDRMHIASDDWQVDPKTIGQFTGMFDKNGTKIFEGDIVKLDDRLCQVTWLDGNAQFDLRFIRDFGDIRIINFKGCEMRELYRYEIIGNICDNPEMLQGGADWEWRGVQEVEHEADGERKGGE